MEDDQDDDVELIACDVNLHVRAHYNRNIGDMINPKLAQRVSVFGNATDIRTGL